MLQSQVLDSVLAVLRGHHAITTRTATSVDITLRSTFVRVFVIFEGPLELGAWRCTIEARFDPATPDLLLSWAESRFRVWVDAHAPGASLYVARDAEQTLRASCRLRLPFHVRDAVLEGIAIAASKATQ